MKPFNRIDLHYFLIKFSPTILQNKLKNELNDKVIFLIWNGSCGKAEKLRKENPSKKQNYIPMVISSGVRRNSWSFFVASADSFRFLQTFTPIEVVLHDYNGPKFEGDYNSM